MAIINNPEVKKALIDGAKINIVIDDVPSELGKTVVPVMSVNPPKTCNVSGYKTKTSTGTITAYTTPLDKDFYLSTLQFSWTADATNDGVLNMVSVDVDDVAVETEVLNVMKNPLTAQHGVEFISFPKPLKMKRGGNIKITQTFTAGNGGMKLCWTGYTQE